MSGQILKSGGARGVAKGKGIVDDPLAFGDPLTITLMDNEWSRILYSWTDAVKYLTQMVRVHIQVCSHVTEVPTHASNAIRARTAMHQIGETLVDDARHR